MFCIHVALCAREEASDEDARPLAVLPEALHRPGGCRTKQQQQCTRSADTKETRLIGHGSHGETAAHRMTEDRQLVRQGQMAHNSFGPRRGKFIWSLGENQINHTLNLGIDEFGDTHTHTRLNASLAPEWRSSGRESSHAGTIQAEKQVRGM